MTDRNPVERDCDDVIPGNSLANEVILEKRIEKIRFAASPDAGDDLDQPIVFFPDNPVQVDVSVDQHRCAH